jgi:hypothetical protein
MPTIFRGDFRDNRRRLIGFGGGSTEIPRDLIRSPSSSRSGEAVAEMEIVMLDAIFVVLGIAIFAGACGYAALCDRI